MVVVMFAGMLVAWLPQSRVLVEADAFTPPGKQRFAAPDALNPYNRQLLENIERPALCSVPLAVCLVVLQFPTGSLADGVELALLVVCGTAVYLASALALARGELRTIAAAFRSS